MIPAFFQDQGEAFLRQRSFHILDTPLTLHDLDLDYFVYLQLGGKGLGSFLQLCKIRALLCKGI